MNKISNKNRYTMEIKRLEDFLSLYLKLDTSNWYRENILAHYYKNLDFLYEKQREASI